MHDSHRGLSCYLRTSESHWLSTALKDPIWPLQWEFSWLVLCALRELPPCDQENTLPPTILYLGSPESVQLPSFFCGCNSKTFLRKLWQFYPEPRASILNVPVVHHCLILRSLVGWWQPHTPSVHPLSVCVAIALGLLVILLDSSFVHSMLRTEQQSDFEHLGAWGMTGETIYRLSQKIAGVLTCTFNMTYQ